MQDLFGIAALVLIVQKFEYFARLALNHLFILQNKITETKHVTCLPNNQLGTAPPSFTWVVLSRCGYIF